MEYVDLPSEGMTLFDDGSSGEGCKGKGGNPEGSSSDAAGDAEGGEDDEALTLHFTARPGDVVTSWRGALMQLFIGAEVGVVEAHRRRPRRRRGGGS